MFIYMKSVIELKKIKSELKSVIKKTIKEEMMKIRAEILPLISDTEQEEINKRYKKPLEKAVKSRSIHL